MTIHDPETVTLVGLSDRDGAELSGCAAVVENQDRGAGVGVVVSDSVQHTLLQGPSKGRWLVGELEQLSP